MHTLHFILNFKSVVLSEVNNRQHCVGMERFNASFEILVFPLCNKIVFNKVLQFWFEIVYELIIVVDFYTKVNFFNV
jgi:hypothetical protein